jgi:predicted nucleic acid-binding protein
MAPPFVDANIFLRHLTQDHPDLSRRATAFLQRIERGELRARTPDLIVFEVVFTLQRSYHQPKATIRGLLLPLLDLPGIVLPGKRRLRAVFDLYVNLNISFADAYHAVLMERLGLEEIATFDDEFDRVPGIRRVTL